MRLPTNASALPFRLLATDYDGTVARHGVISTPAEAALRELQAAGLQLALVTGREFDDLCHVCRQLPLFDMVVAEDGALLYYPESGQVECLIEPPPGHLFDELRRRDVPYSAGRLICSTTLPHVEAMQRAITELGLDLEPSYNKDSVMFLPQGMGKPVGLAAGLARMGIDAAAVIAVGDAQNDLGFLAACGLAVAPANALDDVKAAADIVMDQENGDGLAEFVRLYLHDPQTLERQRVARRKS